MEKIRLRACALIIENDAILLVEFKNDHDDGDGVHYNLPAGGLEPGETLVEAAIRPLSELPFVELYPEISGDIIDYYNGSAYRNYVEEHEIQLGKQAR
ncbi:NUDIX domain-containing protein [Paenibacillus gorillae]|uniref:NUDIX domain-containing protein n=1 Tax=Paenibacillus gorillae TaxID=1243662 RepID=UPI0004BBF4DA|nr:NUDIX domain-containing protein [Paenibacillus gorillae]